MVIPQAPKSRGMLPAMEVKMQLENLFMDLEKDIETPSEERICYPFPSCHPAKHEV